MGCCKKCFLLLAVLLPGIAFLPGLPPDLDFTAYKYTLYNYKIFVIEIAVLILNGIFATQINGANGINWANDPE